MENLNFTNQQINAAITVQSFVRMCAAKEKFKKLKSLFENTKEYFFTNRSVILDCKKLNSIENSVAQNPKFGNHRLDIYLLKDLPIVIRSGQICRVKKMQVAHFLCCENKFRFVDVPEFIVRGNCIIEEKLPNAGVLEGMAIYYKNHEKCTAVVKEFVNFLCMSQFTDLAGGQFFLQDLDIAPIPRFDNVTLFTLDQKKFYIKMIDLEHFFPLKNKATPVDITQALQFGAILFPFHLETIWEVGKNYCDLSQIDVERVKKNHRKSLKLYKLICEGAEEYFETHREWIPLNESRKEQLSNKVEKFLMNMHIQGFSNDVKDTKSVRYDCFEEEEENLGLNCLKGNAEEAVQRFKNEIYPEILNAIEEVLNELVLRSQKNECKYSFESQLSNRVFHKNIVDKIIDRTPESVKQKSSSIFEGCSMDYYDIVIKQTLNELVIGGELFLFKSNCGLKNIVMV